MEHCSRRRADEPADSAETSEPTAFSAVFAVFATRPFPRSVTRIFIQICFAIVFGKSDESMRSVRLRLSGMDCRQLVRST
ncbi:MAG TPA: hypothetical protein DIT89_15670 [Planctomycetaceae bacterium]|nr:hypothetical protein [Planctomycetaceae bacterium]